VPVYGHYVFPKPSVKGSRQLLIPRIAAVGTSFSPLPCQAWHNYGVTSAHRVEVEVGADGSASAPLSGAAAAAPPAGACRKGALNEANLLSRRPNFVPKATIPLFWDGEVSAYRELRWKSQLLLEDA
jgi:hypothetical protein